MSETVREAVCKRGIERVGEKERQTDTDTGEKLRGRERD